MVTWSFLPFAVNGILNLSNVRKKLGKTGLQTEREPKPNKQLVEGGGGGGGVN